MNARTGKSNRGSPATRSPLLKIGALTRAIRSGLTLSVGLLALSGTGASVAADSCLTPSPAGSCVAVLQFGAELDYGAVEDLVSVGSDSQPSSVLSTFVFASDGIANRPADLSDPRDFGGAGLRERWDDVAMPPDVFAIYDVTVVNDVAIYAADGGVADVIAWDLYASGNLSIENQLSGTVTAIANGGSAIALLATANGSIAITNAGSISATSEHGIALGVFASSNGDANFDNSGSITAMSTDYQAVGVSLSSQYGFATAINSGSISATGGQDQAIAFEATGALGVTMTNSGSVNALSNLGSSIGIFGLSDEGVSSVTNAGSITSVSNSQYFAAIGALAGSNYGTAELINHGLVSSINNSGLAVGLQAYSAEGTLVSNSGYVLAGSYLGAARGVLATAIDGDVVVTNNEAGFIRTVSLDPANASAVGISAVSSFGDVDITNAGTILSISAYGAAFGINAEAGGFIDISNTGTILALNGQYGNAVGMQARSTDGSVAVNNSGNIAVESALRLGRFTDQTTVSGIVAISAAGRYVNGNYLPTGVATVVNSGVVRASGAWFVNGILAGSYGGTFVDNTEGAAIFVTGLNPAGINVVESVNSYANFGVGEVVVNNAGGIFVTQLNDCVCNGINPNGVGIQVVSAFGGAITVNNTGRIGVNTAHNGAGISAYAFAAGVSVTNSGDIRVNETGRSNNTYGILARAAYGTDGIDIVNNGDITITTAAFESQYNYSRVNNAFGLFAVAGRPGSQQYQGGGDVRLINQGLINIQSDFGAGVWAVAHYGSVFATNAGDIIVNNADGIGQAIGIFASGGNIITNNTGVLRVDNTGNISVTGVLNATGIRTQTLAPNNNDPDVSVDITNSGNIFASGQVWAQGITATLGNNNAIRIENSGSVYAIAPLNTREGQNQGHRGNSVGIHTDNWDNGATIINSGDIVAVTRENNQQPGTATGVQIFNGLPENLVRYAGVLYGDSVFNNTGTISATLVSSNTIAVVPSNINYGTLLQFGPANTASGVLATSTYGDVAMVNSGSISGRALSDHNAAGGAEAVTTANGIALVTTVGTYDYVHAYHYVYNPVTYTNERVYDGVASTLTLGDITLVNDAAGVILAYASSNDATDTTALANGITATVVMGDYGDSLVSLDTGITIRNAGLVSATAVVARDPAGIAIANGIAAINYSPEGYSTVHNSGEVTATATTTGSATAIGIQATAEVVNVTLDAGGRVIATATGTSGSATGLAISGGAVTASNAGVLGGTFIGSGGFAYGAAINSTGPVNFVNTGMIVASNVEDAVGVALSSESTTLLTNSGTIAGVSSTGQGTAIQTGASSDTVHNSGSIVGQVLSGDGDDALFNAAGGVWRSIGSSDFGAGADSISNAGSLILDDESIAMGDSNGFDNTFTNSGTILAFGDSSVDMGLQNSSAFTNTGLINFRDGAADDTLTIHGNFGGSGQVGVDVSVLSGTGDLLYIDGSVVSNSVTRVNTNILDVLTTRSGSVAVVNVGGDSTAGNFVLGNVTFNPNHSFLLVTGVGMSSSIDTTNARADVFSVDFDVTGLSDAGTLAAAFAPGVQSLMSSQVGTWRQRMGLIQNVSEGFSLWARGFSDSGTVNPENAAGNFGQGGNFSFDQENSGAEVGTDFGFSDQFSAGLLLGQARGKLSLNDIDVGSSTLDADTAGVYATWLSASGFYIDASYRRMSFDAKLRTAAGQTTTSGDADAFNLEAGYAWTLENDFTLEPQFQYTRTTVEGVDTLNGALTGFTPEDGSSSRARIGVAARKTFASGNQIWTPYVAVSAVREFDGENSYTINGTFHGSTETEGTSALVEGGVNLMIGKLAIFGGVSWQDGGALDSFVGGQLGLRYSW